MKPIAKALTLAGVLAAAALTPAERAVVTEAKTAIEAAAADGTATKKTPLTPAQRVALGAILLNVMRDQPPVTFAHRPQVFPQFKRKGGRQVVLARRG